MHLLWLQSLTCYRTACRYRRTFCSSSTGPRCSMRVLLNLLAIPCFPSPMSTMLSQGSISLCYNFLSLGLRSLPELLNQALMFYRRQNCAHLWLRCHSFRQMSIIQLYRILPCLPRSLLPVIVAVHGQNFNPRTPSPLLSSDFCFVSYLVWFKHLYTREIIVLSSTILLFPRLIH